MKINYNDYLEDPRRNFLKITKEDVIRTVTNPLQKQRIRIKELTVLLFLRQEPNSETYLLMMGKVHKQNIFLLEVCFRILPELLEKVGNNEPLLLLQQLANNFGANLTFGSTQGRFIFREFLKVPINNNEPLKPPTIEIPPDSSGMALFYSIYRENIGYDCAMAFSINVKSYLAWLNKQVILKISPKKYELFISYKRNTASDFASHLKKSLTEEGYITFLDLTDIPKEFEGTSKWFDVIDEAIKNSKRFLVIITIAIDTSDEVPKELTLARSVPNMKFIYLRHYLLKPQIILKTSNHETINLGESNQETFSNEFDLARKVLQILQDTNN